MNPHKKRNFFADLFLHDCWRKLVALFLALLLYMFVAPRTGEKHEKTFNDVPVQIELPANLALVDTEARKVKITLSGNERALENIDPGELIVRAEINADRVTPGELYRLRLRITDVKNLPYGVRVSSISPRELPLDLEQVITKSVPVSARYESQGEGDFSKNYDITSTICTPSRVLITGPARLLNATHEITTAPIPLNNQINGDFSYRCSLNILPGIRVERTDVMVNTSVIARTDTASFMVPIKVLYPSQEHELRVDGLEGAQVQITLKGPKNSLNALPPNPISATVSVDQNTPPGEQYLPIQITTATIISNNNRITVQDHQPRSIKVTVINPQVKKDEPDSVAAPEKQQPSEQHP